MEDLFTPEPYFYLADFKNLVKHYQPIAQTMHDIMTYSPIGTQLLQWAAHQNIAVQASQRLEGTEQGNCNIQDKENVLITLNAEHAPFMPFLLCHELGHAHQHLAHDALSPLNNIRAPAPYAIAGYYSAEASTNAMAARILFEMKQNGQSAPFDIMKEGHLGYSAYRDIFEAFEQTYHLAKDRKGHDDELALRLAANAAYEAWFNPRNVSLYAEQVIMSYLDAIYTKRLIIPCEPQIADSEKIAAAAKIHPQTEIFAYPPFNGDYLSVFTEHPALKNLAKALEAHRAMKFSPANILPQIAREFEAQSNKSNTNPYYIGIDFAKLNTALKENSTRPVHEQLDMMDIVNEQFSNSRAMPFRPPHVIAPHKSHKPYR